MLSHSSKNGRLDTRVTGGSAEAYATQQVRADYWTHPSSDLNSYDINMDRLH